MFKIYIDFTSILDLKLKLNKKSQLCCYFYKLSCCFAFFVDTVECTSGCYAKRIWDNTRRTWNR